MKNRNLVYCFIVACVLISGISNAYCQCCGTLKGKITDKDTKKGIPLASVVLDLKGKQFAATTSDTDGNYIIKKLPAGKYDLKAKQAGYDTVLIKGIKITKRSITIKNVEFQSIPIQDELKHSPNNIHMFDGKKPAIYLYPTRTQEVKVKLDFKGKIGNTFPEYKDGWTVKASPDGRLLNLDDKRNYNYLFWDGIIYSFTKEHYDYKSGFIVKKNEVVDFLQSKLSLLGLNETEINDFIVYWLPQLNKNDENLIHFWVNDNIDNSAFMDIEPKPDTEIVVFMEFKKADSNQTIPEQKLPKLERKGFTVVEWGGGAMNNE